MASDFSQIITRIKVIFTIFLFETYYSQPDEIESWIHANVTQAIEKRFLATQVDLKDRGNSVNGELSLAQTFTQTPDSICNRTRNEMQVAQSIAWG